MAEARVQEIPKKELNLNFFVRLVEVRSSLVNFYRLDISIKDPNGNEIKHEYLNPGEHEFSDILENIKKLYDVLKMSAASGNEKLVSGAREEILSLIAVLISKIY
jgi:hypothetical protein